MTLNSKSFALALAVTFGIVYIICAIVIAVAPEVATSLYGSLSHLEKVEPRVITTGGFISGLVQVLVYSYLVGWVLAAIYNKSSR